MKITLDGKNIPYEEDIALKLEEQMKEESRVVRSITINDVEMVNASLQEVFEGPDSKKTVVVETCSVDSLIKETIRDASDYIPRLRDGFLSVRDLVLGGESVEAKKLLDACFEGLEWLMLTLEAATMAEEFASLKEVFLAEREKMAGAFPELETAMRDDDMILVSDILEYEIVPFMEAVLPETDKING